MLDSGLRNQKLDYWIAGYKIVVPSETRNLSDFNSL